MSIFNTKGLVCNVNKLGENECIYDIFSYEFGRIKVQKKRKKKEKPLDLGYIANFEIETKEGRNIHKMRGIRIHSEFQYTDKNFHLIESYLTLLSLLLKKLPEGLVMKEVFEILESINKKENLNETHITLASLKVISCFGELPIEHKNVCVAKILKFVYHNKIKDIFRLSGIDEATRKILDDSYKI